MTSVSVRAEEYRKRGIKRRNTTALNEQAVNAIRAMLGMQPLYGRARENSYVRAFGEMQLSAWPTYGAADGRR